MSDNSGQNPNGGRPRPSDRGSPRFVTVLFVDVVNSTGLLGADLDKALIELDQVQETARAAIHQYGGMIARVQGDGIMAIFGAPAPLENHALHACCAALRIRDAFRALARGASAGDRLALREVRIGVHTGTLVTRRRKNDAGEDYDVVGIDAHIAGKIQGKAAANTALVSGVTLDLAGPAVVAKRLRTLQIAGVPDVPIHELKAINLHLDIDRIAERGHVSPLVGRSRELSRLIAELDAVGPAKGAAAAVVAGAGLGKSRLLYEMFKSARTRGFRVAELRGLSVQKHTPFGPLKALALGFLGLPRDAARADVERALKAVELPRHLQCAILEFSGFEPDDAEWAELNAMLRRQALFAGVAALVERAVANQPCLLIVEDAQQLDSETLDVVDQLKGLTAKRPLVMVVSVRNDARALAGKLAQHVIDLAPLPPDAARELCNVLATGTQIAASAINHVIAAAAGVPMILQEMMRELQRGGAKANAAPIGVTNLVHARMGALSDRARDVMHAAGILAENIDRHVLATTADVGADALTEALDELDRQDLVDATDPRTVSFRCEIFRDAVLNTLLAGRKTEIHANAVRAYEQTGRKDANTFERLAHHCEQSGNIAGALANISEAVKLAVRSWSLKTVRALYGWAMRLDAPSELAPMLAAIAKQSFDALQQSGDGEYRKALDFVVEHASKTGDRESEALARGHLALLDWMQARLEDGLVQGEIAMRLARELDSLSLRSIVQPHLANIEHARGNIARAIELHMDVVTALVERGLEHETFGRMILPSARSRAFAAWLMAECGRFDEAQIEIEKGEAALKKVDQPYTRVLLNAARGILAIRRGAPQDAIAPLEEAHKSCLTLYFYVMEAGVAGWLATALVLVGRPQEALTRASGSIDSGLYRHAGRYSWVYVHQGLAEAQFACGQSAEALETIARAIAIAEESREPIHVAQAVFARGLMRAALGDVEAGSQDIVTALAAAEKHGLAPLAAECRRALAEIAAKRSGKAAE